MVALIKVWGEGKTFTDWCPLEELEEVKKWLDKKEYFYTVAIANSSETS